MISSRRIWNFFKAKYCSFSCIQASFYHRTGAFYSNMIKRNKELLPSYNFWCFFFHPFYFLLVPPSLWGLFRCVGSSPKNLGSVAAFCQHCRNTVGVVICLYSCYRDLTLVCIKTCEKARRCLLMGTWHLWGDPDCRTQARARKPLIAVAGLRIICCSLGSVEQPRFSVNSCNVTSACRCTNKCEISPLI